MRITRYLVVNSRGSCRITKTTPAIEADEVKIELDLRLPDILFKKPSLRAEVIVTDEMVSPSVINVETVETIKDTIKSVTGVDLSITIKGDEEK